MLQETARDFLSKECPKSKVRELEGDEKGHDPELWHKMAGLGWMGLLFPEEYGGMEGDFLDLAILIEEMGRNILPSPFFPTVVLSGLPILEYGTSEQKNKFLSQIANGEAIWTLALTEESAILKPSGIRLLATQEGEKYLVEGTKLFSPYAHIADYLLVVARTGEAEKAVTAFIVDTKSPGINIEIMPTIAHDKQCAVSFDKVEVNKNDILGEVDKGWDIVEFILQRPSVLKCAEVLGASQAVLDMASSYAKERIQFDKPIGSFQGVQFRLADNFIDVEGLRYLTYRAAWEISVGSPSNLNISLAKAKANEVYQRVCIDGIRTHGAIGFTADHDIGLYFRRVKEAEFALGDSNLHRERIAAELEL